MEINKFNMSSARVNPKEITQAQKEETKKVEEAKAQEVAFKKADADGLKALGWQNMGLHLTKVDKSDEATFARLEKTMPTFLTGLDKEFGYETDVAAQMMAMVKGCDPDKLNRHMQKPLSTDTTTGVDARMEEMISLA